MTTYHIVVIVWGRSYIDRFLDVSVLTQLSPGNLPDARDRARFVYKIYTTEEGRDYVRAHTVYQRLAQCAPVEFRIIDPSGNNHDYLVKSYKDAFAEANACDAALINILPDCFIGNGTFVKLLELAGCGKRAVVCYAIRLAQETFVPHFMREAVVDGAVKTSVTNRQIMALAMQHLHPSQIPYIMGENIIPQSGPSNLNWRVGKSGLLTRSFHLWPILIHPTRKDVVPMGTLDNSCIERACPCFDDIHVVKDSDELLMLGLDSQSTNCCGWLRPGVFAPPAVALWASLCTDKHQKVHYKYKIRFHAEPLNDEWRDVEKQSDNFVREVYRYLRIIENHPNRTLIPDPMWLDFQFPATTVSADILLPLALSALRPREAAIRSGP